MAEVADAEVSCPICLVSSNDEPAEEHGGAIAFVKTPCGHAFCKPCIERVLLKPRQNAIPTRGQCPMCRTPVSLFDMTLVDDGQCTTAESESLAAYEKETDASSWPIANFRFSQRSMLPRQNTYENLQRIFDRNLVIEGYGITFCFEEDSPSMKFSNKLKLAYDCDWTEIMESNDGDLLALDVIPFDQAHFHQKSLTFHGNISFAHPVCSKDRYFYEKLDCLLHFSNDLRFIRKGNLRWKYAPTDIQLYPLDGTWEVHFSPGDKQIIHVQNNFFTCFGAIYNVTIDNHTQCAQFTWEGSNQPDVTQISNQRILPGSINVGDNLDWTTNAHGQEHIVWKRLKSDLSDSWRSVDITVGKFVYRKCSAEEEQLGPSYQTNTLWGNTFCQGFCVGLASYHFLEPQSDNDLQAYVSYESPRTDVWPALDNGETVPSRVPFRNIQWDPETRTFKGDICWEEDYGTSWMSESRWSYVITFDPTFMFVQSGTVTRSDGPPHRFGQDLVYVNAACETTLEEIFQITRGTEHRGEYLDIIRQCRDNGASGGTVQMLGEVAMNIMNGGESFFDYNL